MRSLRLNFDARTNWTSCTDRTSQFASSADLACTAGSAGTPGGQRSMYLLTPSELVNHWQTDPRWSGITRPYSSEDVAQLRGSVHVEHTLARLGAERLWHLLHREPYVPALGALTGNQAVQQVQAGLKAIYLS